MLLIYINPNLTLYLNLQDRAYYGTSGLPTGKLYGVPTEPLHPVLIVLY